MSLRHRVWVVLALTGALCACAGRRDLVDERKSLPPFQHYGGEDGATLYMAYAALWDTLDHTCDVVLLLDGRRAEIGTGRGYTMSPGSHSAEMQMVRTDARKYPAEVLTSDVAKLALELEPKGEYVFAAVCDPQGGVDADFRKLGSGEKLAPIPGAPPADAENESLSLHQIMLREEQRVVDQHNLFYRVWTSVKLDQGGLLVPTGLVAGVDAQGLVDKAKPSVDCAKGNEVLLHDGLTSAGQRLGVYLACKGTPPRWQAPVRISGAELDWLTLSTVQSRDFESISRLYGWLQKQSLQPRVPADRLDELAVEIRDLLAGDRPLRPARR